MLNNFANIFRSNNVRNIQDVIEKGFRYIYGEYYLGVNDYFCPRRTHQPHSAPNYGPEKYNHEIDYYR